MKFAELKAIVRRYGLQREVLTDPELCGVPWDAIKAAEGRKEGPGCPCPYCGGHDRFKVKNLDGDVEIFCRQRHFGSFEKRRQFGDEIDGIIANHRLSNAGEAARKLEDWLEARGYLDSRQWKGGYR